VEVHDSRLRRKLHGSGLSIRTVHGRGYVLGADIGDERRSTSKR
jgi:DNA-binding response OmpR family regulator